MNNAQNFVQSLVGFSFTFKPIEKGKDRPVQTINIHDTCDMPISSGGTVPGFNCTLTFAGKRGTIQTQRQISVARMLEYVGQAASDPTIHEEVIYVAPPPKEKKEKVVKEKPVKEAKKTKKQLAAEEAAAAAASEVNEVEPDEDFGDPFAGQED
jgi:hypothetical protein